MRLCIIGAAGQVGQEFRRLLAASCVVAVEHAELDVTDADQVHARLAGLDVDAYVNLAAYHDVNGCELAPEEAYAVNALGARNVARVAAACRRKVVFLSTDYVFGGDLERRRPYLEDDPPAPLNVYGTAKLAGEHLVRASARDHLIVRTSSLFGRVTSRKGWTFPERMLERARGGDELSVVDDQVMAPTYTLDLASRIIELLEAGRSGTYHVVNGGSCSWYELARATLELAGVDAPLRPVRSDAFPATALRPAYSVLGTEPTRTGQPLRPWRDALAAWLRDRDGDAATDSRGAVARHEEEIRG